MDHESTQMPSYWTSVSLAALITALVLTITSTLGGYMTLASEPTGSFFSTSQLWGLLGCLLAAVGGVFANWHYANEYDLTYKIGKGALIGFWVAVLATVFSMAFTYLWTTIIDPAYMDALIEWQKDNIEAMSVPDEAKQGALEGISDPYAPATLAIQAVTTLVSLAVVNVISGIIGAKLFASED